MAVCGELIHSLSKASHFKDKLCAQFLWGCFMLRFALSLMLLIAHSLTWAEAFEFKGVPFGASEQQFLEKHPEFWCSDAQGPLETVLSDRTCYLFKMVLMLRFPPNCR